MSLITQHDIDEQRRKWAHEDAEKAARIEFHAWQKELHRRIGASDVEGVRNQLTRFPRILGVEARWEVISVHLYNWYVQLSDEHQDAVIPCMQVIFCDGFAFDDGRDWLVMWMIWIERFDFHEHVNVGKEMLRRAIPRLLNAHLYLTASGMWSQMKTNPSVMWKIECERQGSMEETDLARQFQIYFKEVYDELQTLKGATQELGKVEYVGLAPQAQRPANRMGPLQRAHVRDAYMPAELQRAVLSFLPGGSSVRDGASAMDESE